MRLAARIPIPVLTLHLLLLGAQPAARADDLPGFRPLGCGRTDLMLGQVPALIGASSMQDEVYAYRHATDTPGETVILYWGEEDRPRVHHPGGGAGSVDLHPGVRRARGRPAP